MPNVPDGDAATPTRAVQACITGVRELGGCLVQRRLCTGAVQYEKPVIPKPGRYGQRPVNPRNGKALRKTGICPRV